MLPRILHPEQLQGFRLGQTDHCRLALLSNPEQGACTMFLEVHDPCDRVPPHAHHHAAELCFVQRGTAIFHDGGFADLLQHGIPTPLDQEDLQVLRSL